MSIATARIAGIMAAKRTGEFVLLCHPLGIEVTVTRAQGATGDCGDGDHGGTHGCEMEALTAVGR